MPDEQFSAPIRLELPFALERTTVNAYLFLAPEPILIDTGDLADATWQALEAGLAQHGLAVGDLCKVIISHTHIDHFGQAARLAETSDAHFYVIDAGFNWLTRFTEHWQMRYDYYRTVFLPATGMPAGEQQKVLFFSNRVLDIYRGVPAARVTALHPGEHLELGPYIWEVLHLPGHASTQTCFYQPATRQLLASDMLLRRTPTPVLEPPLDGSFYKPALPDFVQSLHRVARLEMDVVYPGHGAPFHDAHELIRRQLARIEARKFECLHHVQAGIETAYALLLAMYPVGSMVNMAGLWMLIGYLDLLQQEGRVRMTQENGLWRYHAL